MIETAQAFGVDIGGSGIKAAPVNLEKGEFAQPRLKILTPEHSTPKASRSLPRFTRVRSSTSWPTSISRGSAWM